MLHHPIRHSLAGDKPCPCCNGTGKPASGSGYYIDDKLGCVMPDYCDICSGTGIVAIVCDYCDGAVNENGYCRSCDEHTPVQPVSLVDVLHESAGRIWL